MHLFHHFLMVEIILSEADFEAESGISQDNGPIISRWNTSFGRNMLYHHGHLTNSPGGKKDLFFEERKKMALNKHLLQDDWNSLEKVA